jgi:glutamyl-Q tRNA(Asp) synthetase
MAHYVGRFAPSPSGPLHAGSLTTALASWLDAQSHQGHWLVRIEDIDAQRCDPLWVEVILGQLANIGLHPQAPPVWQSQRSALYESAIEQLKSRHQIYACDCSRKLIRSAVVQAPTPDDLSPRDDHDMLYPGICRQRGLQGGAQTAWRLRVGLDAEPVVINWADRRLGAQTQDLMQTIGDFVLKRRDGAWAYQLAVVTDDADQGVTHVVRGEDLASNTARQIYLQRCLNLAPVHYLHTPLLFDEQGHKLSKHRGAPAAMVNKPELARQALQDCAQTLALHLPSELWLRPTLNEILMAAVQAWRVRWAMA